MVKRKRKYWYKTYAYECPLCGRGPLYRERVYGRKPKDPYKRYHWEERYDYCDAL